VSSKSGDIALQGGNLAIVEIRAPFKARDIGLVDLRITGNFDLSFPNRFAQCPKRQSHALGGTQATS